MLQVIYPRKTKCDITTWTEASGLYKGIPFIGFILTVQVKLNLGKKQNKKLRKHFSELKGYFGSDMDGIGKTATEATKNERAAENDSIQKDVIDESSTEDHQTVSTINDVDNSPTNANAPGVDQSVAQITESEDSPKQNISTAESEKREEEQVPTTKTTTSPDVFKRPHSSPIQKQTAERSAEKDFGDYAEHVTYEKDGTIIYTDPNTKQQYKWCEKERSWIPSATDGRTIGKDGERNPFESEHYRWCSETQSWKPKDTQVTETEYYKWDAKRNEWIPKQSINLQSNVGSVSGDGSGSGSGITYSVDENGQRIYTDKDGVVYFWDEEKNAWFPKIDDDFMARYQMNYGFIDNVSAGEEEKRQKEAAEAKRKDEELQRMAEEARIAMDATATAAAAAAASSGSSAVKHKAAQEPPKWFEIDAEHNTKVYVSNLPLDITLDEFAELMGKCGMIMRDPQTQKFKLKLYTEADGQIKGDGLCDYIKVESVKLALNILDEYVYRGHKIRVQRAKFEMRGEYNPALKPKRKKKDKEKLQKMKERLFDWRPEKMRGERTKNEKVVIIKNLFTPDIFEKDVQLILDYQNDLREECGKCGIVRKVVIYDCHPEGVAQINMASPEEADLVIQMMQGRFFGKRQLSAEHWDGKTKYKVAESENKAEERLTNWDQFLEADADKVE